jgi:hypothetical protein
MDLKFCVSRMTANNFLRLFANRQPNHCQMALSPTIWRATG